MTGDGLRLTSRCLKCAEPHVSRRAALGGLAGFMATSAIAAETAPPASRAIDVHHHVLSPRYIASKRAEILANGPGFPKVLEWTPEQSLAAMDQAGVAKSILSVSAPGVYFGDVREGRDIARECNEYSAGLKTAHPTRFGYFAALPLPDIEGSLAELSFAMDKLKADGAGLLTSYGNRYLGDPAFAPVMAELNRRKAIVYVHPTGADCCRNLTPDLPPAFLEFPYDTTRTIASLLYSGSLVRWPDIRFIFSHGGGALPTLGLRMAGWANQPGVAARVAPRGVLAELKRHFYDTASITNELAYPALKRLVGDSQILFGTDFPFGNVKNSLDALAKVTEPAAFDAIARTNAVALLGA